MRESALLRCVVFCLFDIRSHHKIRMVETTNDWGYLQGNRDRVSEQWCEMDFATTHGMNFIPSSFLYLGPPGSFPLFPQNISEPATHSLSS